VAEVEGTELKDAGDGEVAQKLANIKLGI